MAGMWPGDALSGAARENEDRQRLITPKQGWQISPPSIPLEFHAFSFNAHDHSVEDCLFLCCQKGGVFSIFGATYVHHALPSSV